ncbi:hypothetical protein QQ045_019682 [Rhodiola kirilowii]
MSASASEALIAESTLESPNSAINAEIEDPKPSGDGGDSAAAEEVEQEEVEVEEEGECGFCLFMKGGGCKDSFVAWEKCVEEAEEKDEDVVSKCAEMTMMLKKCMEAHSEYYEPVLRAEKVAEEEAVKQLEKEAGEAAVEKKEK